MSLGVCIPDLIAQGKITGERAARAQQLYDELVLQYEGFYGREAAEAMATEKAVAALESSFKQAKRQKLLAMKRQAAILHNARHVYDGGKYADGSPVGGDAMVAHLVQDSEHASGIANVEYRWRNIKQQAWSMMNGVLEKHRRTLTGAIRNPADFDLLLRELHGENTGDLNARELADSWRQGSEWLRRRFNAAGGDIGKLEDWGLPHSHDALRVGSVDAEEWIDFVLPMLDRDRMVDYSTGLPFSEARLRDVLREVHDTIRSDGWNKRAAGAMGQGKVANRYDAHRILHFRSAADWISYNERFGAVDPFDAMTSHVERMSRDIATMEILGPNPAATIRWMQDMVAKEANLSPSLKARAGIEQSGWTIEKIWDQISGQNRRAVSRNLALFGSTLRNWQVSTKLGSAVLSALSDAGTAALTRAYNGLPATRTVRSMLRQLNPADPDARAFARRAGLISDEFIGRVNQAARFQIDDTFGSTVLEGDSRWTRGLTNANEWTRRMADGTLRVSGLNAWTIGGREAMGMEFMSAIAQFAARDFDALDAPFRNFLTRYGMGRADWDVLRATPMESWKGMDWIMPDNIADQALRDRLMEGIYQEIEYAVPTGGVYRQALVNQARPGTILGEIIKTGFQFKMFPITVMALHGGRMLAQSSLATKAGYGVAFLGATTIPAMLSVQLAEISKGRDPLPMDNATFLKKALLKGGGLGIYGDLINQSTGEYGQDIGDITKGPAWATGQNVVDLVTEGKVAQFLKRETPGSSIWFVRAAYERLLVDTVGEWTDGDYADHYKRMQRRAEQDGTDYYTVPGGGLRLPDLANALEGELPEPAED